MSGVSCPAASGLECTEDEPDDDFRPSTAGRKSAAAPAESQEIDAAADDDLGQTAPATPVSGPRWHQLEGVAQPPGTGPPFLAWNDRGRVAFYPSSGRLEVQHSGEPEPQRVEANAGHCMAAVSDSLSCLASGAGSAPRLTLRPAQRWERATFSAPLGAPGEAPEAVACGEGFAAAATSERMLRIYSASGLPLGVSSLPGLPYALAARGGLLLAVTRQPGCQEGPLGEGNEEALEFLLLHAQTHSRLAAGRLPLSPGARLRWVGLSAELFPVAVDTTGAVRAFLLGSGPGAWGRPGAGGEWLPVLSLAEEEKKAGPLWILGARGGSLLCAEVEPDGGDDGFPDGAGAAEGAAAEPPRRLHELPWRLPLGPLPAASSATEEALRKWLLLQHIETASSLGLLASERDDIPRLQAEWKAGAIKLFGRLAQGDKTDGALDVAHMVRTTGDAPRLLGMMQRLAEKAGRDRLADQVSALPRGPPPSPARRAPAGAGASPWAWRRQGAPLPPLFQPGEELEQRLAPVGAADAWEAAAAAAAAGEGPAAPESAPPPEPEKPQRARAEALPETPSETLSEAAAAAPLAAAASPPGPAASAAAEAPAAHEKPPPAPAPAASANPFARSRQPKKSTFSQRLPHLLRDALGGGSAAAEPARRPAPPATPMGTSGRGVAEEGAFGEPAHKAPRVAAATAGR